MEKAHLEHSEQLLAKLALSDSKYKARLDEIALLKQQVTEMQVSQTQINQQFFHH
jgi:hypothetical protein